MAAERGQRLRHGLLVADVGKDVRQHRQPRARVGGYVQPGLVHQAQQAQGPQRDRLAAGVRAGDEQRRVVAAEPNVDRHHVTGQAGVARAEQDDLRPFGDVGRNGIHLLGEMGLGGPEIEARECFERLPQRPDLAGDHHRQLVEDPLDLGLLRHLGLAPGVAQLNGHDRLHEQRLAAAGRIVDDALHLAAGIGADRDHVSAAAQRDDGLLQRTGQLTRMHELVQARAKPFVGDLHRPAKSAEPWRCRVEQLPGGVEAARQNAAQAGESVNLARQIAQKRPSVAAQRLTEPRGRLQRVGDLQEVRRVQPSAACRPLDPRRDVLCAADTGARMLADERTRLRRLLDTPAHDHGVGGGLQRLGQAAPGPNPVASARRARTSWYSSSASDFASIPPAVTISDGRGNGPATSCAATGGLRYGAAAGLRTVLGFWGIVIVRSDVCRADRTRPGSLRCSSARACPATARARSRCRRAARN